MRSATLYVGVRFASAASHNVCISDSTNVEISNGRPPRRVCRETRAIVVRQSLARPDDRADVGGNPLRGTAAPADQDGVPAKSGAASGGVLVHRCRLSDVEA